MLSVNKSQRYWHYEKDTNDSYESLTEIKDRRKVQVQDLIDAYINKLRVVWKTLEFLLRGKTIFQKISPGTVNFSKISPYGRTRTRVDSAPLVHARLISIIILHNHTI